MTPRTIYTLVVRSSHKGYHWLVELEFPYGKGPFHEWKEYIKQFPGCKWLGKPFLRWQFPRSLLETVLPVAQEMGYQVRWASLETSPQVDRDAVYGTPELLEHQAKAVYNTLLEPRPIRFLLTDDAGLGKTNQAIHCMKFLNVLNPLIVCPAALTKKWEREVSTWWPASPTMEIVSYHSLKKRVGKKYDCVILDEIHHLQSEDTTFTKEVREVIKGSPTCHVIGLTATIFPDRPRNLYSVAETIRPGEFGTYGKFSFRYTNAVAVDIGNDEIRYEYQGVRNEVELRERLACFTVRTTKQDVMHLLNMPTVYTIEVPIKGTAPRLSGDVRDWLGSSLNWACRAKLPHIQKWYEETQATHKCIFVHHKELVKVIAESLEGENIFALTGAVSAKKRDAIIEKTRDLTNATIVATMHSVGEGLDLQHFEEALFAELYWRPKTVIQALNRFPRLGGEKTNIGFLIMKGTADEVVANSLLQKITDIGELQANGVGEVKLLEALGARNEDEIEEQIMETLMGTFASGLSEVE